MPCRCRGIHERYEHKHIPTLGSQYNVSKWCRICSAYVLTEYLKPGFRCGCCSGKVRMVGRFGRYRKNREKVLTRLQKDQAMLLPLP